ncbi:hypothetical protein KSP40_PGU013570 [Platanthera guangdongensis]|uniref:DEK-C domain-containing protein n=1 Tax=Platanthera guangdongensis TaxID=2320717 RepID=A0ABR2MNY4_9ASPA
MRARVKDFKNQADSLTLEGVRRALEKDLGRETFSLDVHKRFIKQCLEEQCFYGGDDTNLSATTESALDQHSSHLNKEASGASDDRQLKDPKCSSSDINETKKESPAEELMCDHKPLKTGDLELDDKLSENIKKAIKKQSPYLRANLEKMTLAKVRRLLEQDLNLEKNTLDAYKSFISGVLDEILQPTESSEPVNGIKKKPKKAFQNKETGKVKKETKAVTEDSGSSKDNDTSEADDDSNVVKRPKKRPLEKAKSRMKPLKHLKTSSDENIPSGSKKKKREVLDKEGSESDDGKFSEDDRAPSSSDERSKKKHEKPTAQAYGKHVERLKSVIKACGMGVPPSVYKRAKQAPESKREAFLIKELEDILVKEGLSSNPSDKEIKAVKKLKERARELEGIDTSNIVSSSRRRSTFSFIPTPKPKIEAGSGEDDEDEVEEDEDDQEGTDDGDNGSGESSEGSEEGLFETSADTLGIF